MTEHLDAVRRDLALILDQARWCYGMAWEKPGRGLDAERGVLHRAPTPEEAYERARDPDFVAAPERAIDIGDHRARTAYRAAVKAVGTCAVYLDAIVRADGVIPSQPVPELDPAAPPSVLARSITHAQVCAAHVKHPERHTRRLKDLRTRLDAAVRGLSPVLDQGRADDIAHREDTQLERGIPKAHRCRICDTHKALAKSGGRCSKCRAFFKKHGHDDHLAITPRRAMEKRLARGEGWGAA